MAVDILLSLIEALLFTFSLLTYIHTHTHTHTLRLTVDSLFNKGTVFLVFNFDPVKIV
jgi:hypothetical protein